MSDKKSPVKLSITAEEYVQRYEPLYRQYLATRQDAWDLRAKCANEIGELVGPIKQQLMGLIAARRRAVIEQFRAAVADAIDEHRKNAAYRKTVIGFIAGKLKIKRPTPALERLHQMREVWKLQGFDLDRLAGGEEMLEIDFFDLDTGGSMGYGEVRYAPPYEIDSKALSILNNCGLPCVPLLSGMNDTWEKIGAFLEFLKDASKVRPRTVELHVEAVNAALEFPTFLEKRRAELKNTVERWSGSIDLWKQIESKLSQELTKANESIASDLALPVYDHLHEVAGKIRETWANAQRLKEQKQLA